MSKQIDERVVSMQFDNKQFESGVSDTMNSIDKLTSKLNFTGINKGFDNITKSANQVDMSGLSSGVEGIRLKFSALQVAAVTTFANITNQAVNAGKRIVSAFTIDPIKTGFQEYETQINAVQTILANTQSKGTTLDDVNRALDELNKYADQTIYNFTEMTRNIGTFTAAGVELDKSVTSIKGIANLAAVSGSNAQQASTAMYQLSQALAAGKVSLMDWNSVVNAGMGGQLFQDALVRTAAAMNGSAKNVEAWRKANIDSYGSFRDSLTQGAWLTADVLTETLTQLSGAYTEADLISQGYTEQQAKDIMELAKTASDAATKVKTFTQLFDTLKEAAQSGWTQTWEIIVGDFEEAKELLTAVSDTLGGIINKSAEARNNLLQGWKDAGGREDLVASFKNLFDAIVSVIKPINEAFREIFPPMTVKQLTDFTAGLEEFTSKLILSDEAATKVKSTFKGLFAVIDIVVSVISDVAGAAFKLITELFGLGDSVLTVTGSIGDMLSRLRDTVKEGDIFGKTIDAIVNFLTPLIKKVKEVTKVITDNFIATGFEYFMDLMSGLWDIITKVGSKIGDMVSNISNAFLNVFRSGDMSAGMDLLNGGIFAAILFGVKKFVDGLSDALDGITGDDGILGNVIGILDSVKGAFEAWQSSLKADVLKKIAIAIGILTASIVVLSMIDPVKLSASLGAITVLFGNLMGSLFVIDKMGLNFTGVTKTISMMVGMSAGILVLATALKQVADIDTNKLLTSILGLASVTGIMVGAAKLLSMGGPTVLKGAIQMTIFAGAVAILASVAKDLSALDAESLYKGLLGVTVLLGGIAAFLHLAKIQKGTISTATGIVILSGAIKILASACSDFGNMKMETVKQGLISIGLLLAGLAGFTRLVGSPSHIIQTSVALTIIGGAMLIFAEAVKSLGSVRLEELEKGLIAMAIALGTVTAAVNLMPKNMISIGTGLVVLGGSLLIIAEAVKNMGAMSLDEIGKGLVTLGSSLAILVTALNLMKGTVAGSAALLVAAGALAALVPTIKTLGSMDIGTVVQGLIVMAGAFAVLGAAGLLLGPIVGPILAVSGAVTLFGVGCLAAGVGIGALATGLTTLAAAGAAGATAIVASLTIIITGLATLIPTIVTEIAKAVVLFAKTIAEGAPVIAEAVVQIVLAIVRVLGDCVPQLVNGVLKVIVGVLDALAQYTPQIVNSLFKFLINLIDSLADHLPELIQAAVNLFMSFFTGITDALKGIDSNALISAIAGIGFLSAFLVALGALTSLVPAAMTGVLGLGVLIGEIAVVAAALGAFAQIPGLDWLINEGGDLLMSLGSMIGKFVGGFVGGIAEGVTASLPNMATDLSNFMNNLQPFLQGAATINQSTVESVKSLAQAILLITAADVIEGITSWLTGGNSLENFGSELGAFGKGLKVFGDLVKDINPEAIKAAADAALTLANMADQIPNEGGLISLFTGDNKMESFGAQLKSFGKGIKDFGEQVKDINPEAVTAAANASSTLVKMANEIPNEGGLLSIFTGDNKMSTFASQIGVFGKGISDFSNNTSDVNIANVTNAVTAVGHIISMSDTISQSGTLFSTFGGMTSMDMFNLQLSSFASAVKNFVLQMSEINASNIQGIANQLNILTDNLKKFSISGIDTITKNLNSSKPKVIKSVTDIINAMTREVKNKNKEMFNVSKQLIVEFVNGIKSQEASVKTTLNNAIRNAVNDIVNKKSTYSSQMRQVGLAMMDGLKAGIEAGKSSVINAAVRVAVAAFQAACAALGIASPSKKFYEIGMYAGMGLTNALNDYADKTYIAGRDMANSAKSGLSDAMSRINDYIDSDIDMQPVIRPVLDLSNLSSGAGAINGLFGMQPSLGLLANVGSISAMMNGNQNGDNSDIVSAIKDLKNSLDNASGDTYNFGDFTYDDGSNISGAVRDLMRAAKMERRT